MLFDGAYLYNNIRLVLWLRASAARPIDLPVSARAEPTHAKIYREPFTVAMIRQSQQPRRW